MSPVAGLADDLQLRAGLHNCRVKFTQQKTGLVVFLGGSITYAQGWSQLVSAELQRRFPETKFTFVNAGIPSIDSTGHAFRFQRDVLEKGLPDLLFVEAAVNDLHNGREAIERVRGVEGVVRRARQANRFVDIVALHFAELRHTADYDAGRVPEVITSHDQVAAHYQLPTLNLAREVQRRMKAGQFDWARDFKDLHPSPFGHQLYFQAIRRLFDQAWSSALIRRANANEDKPNTDEGELTLREHVLPDPLDKFSYDAGQLISPVRATGLRGFRIVNNWRPADKAGTRDGFVGVPMFVGDTPGDSFSFRFEGRAIGFFLTAGPDSGVLEYRIDGGDWKTRDPFTQWSRGLHLPWVLMLETELASAPHVIEVKLAAQKNDASQGTALRIRDFVVNGPAYDLPKLSEVKIKSSLDGSEQPSLLWAPDAAKKSSTREGGAPLLVYLHSWSSDYRQDNSPWQHEAVQRGWIYLHPNFRGVNRQPQACGSRFARQDILDAIDYVAANFAVDRNRIYLAGTSGGGHLAMLMAGHFPERFSAVSAWVGITDLADWQRFHVKNGQPDHYAQMTIDALGGPPGHSESVDAEYRDRSPLFHLHRATDVPLDIAAGVKDGHTGSVPILHSLRAFNVVAKAGGHAEISPAEMNELWDKEELASPQPSDKQSDPTYLRRLLLRRNAGSARITIFDGGHEGLAPAACAWLAKQKRATKTP